MRKTTIHLNPLILIKYKQRNRIKKKSSAEVRQIIFIIFFSCFSVDLRIPFANYDNELLEKIKL